MLGEKYMDLSKNYRISRQISAQGMVLLKNEDNVLPFKERDKIGIVGKACLDMIRGGGGSAHVQTEYTKNLQEGLLEKARENKIIFYENSAEIARTASEYSVSNLNDLSGNIDIAIVTIRRSGSEGADRKLGEASLLGQLENVNSGEANDERIDDYEECVGYFYLSKKEQELLSNLEKSNIKNVVLVLNISSIVDLSFIDKYPKIKSVLLAFLPGMEGGTAIADVLCGDVNPSGKLVDTVAYNYEDYPTANCFDYDPYITEYKEGIFVGYRYFETFAKEKVMFPFGFGLSYTSFEYSNCSLKRNGDQLILGVDVKNIGEVSGREVVQAYVRAPKGNVEKPAIELKGFHKTKELKVGETEYVEICFELKDLASFDAEGLSGYKAAWVLEKGNYELFVGKSIRDLYSCGTLEIDTTICARQLQLRFDGSQYDFAKSDVFDFSKFNEEFSLYDVAEGKISLEDFVNALSVEELVHLSQGQPPAFPGGTAGVGNIKKRGIPNPQTADGPAGIRRSVNCTCFPCGTLIACSWDQELQFKMGKAMGYEGYNTGVDILLAPSMNIHRNPLGGRNFEYLSEDPVVTGKTAAAIVRGIQSEGLCATIKHFAVNNCEYYRWCNNSVVSERALREVYLKGFEIAVKESNPAFVMTSYNLLNGMHASVHAQLLRGVLRDEWGYEGAVMTDWRNGVPLPDEIMCGNNIKMPFGYPDEIQKAMDAYNNGTLSISCIKENAMWVLKAIMKTRNFLTKDFGVSYNLKDNLVIPAVNVTGISSTRIKQDKNQDGWYLYGLGKDHRSQRTFIYYLVNAENDGDYFVSCTLSTNCAEGEIWIFDENEKRLATISLNSAVEEDKWYEFKSAVSLHKGENILKFVFAEEPNVDYPFTKESWVPGDKDFQLSKIHLRSLK